MSIYKKILAVQKAVETIPKKGFNAFNRYNYATEADVLAVKELMNEHGLIAFPSVESFQTYTRGEQFGFIQHVKYTVVDVETGESIESMVLGAGEDKGDKGAYKAATGASKYFYLKFAGCPTGDDPERDEAPKKQPTVQTNGKISESAKERIQKNDLLAEIKGARECFGITPEQVIQIMNLPEPPKASIEQLILGKALLMDFIERKEKNLLTSEDIAILTGGEVVKAG